MSDNEETHGNTSNFLGLDVEEIGSDVAENRPKHGLFDDVEDTVEKEEQKIEAEKPSKKKAEKAHLLADDGDATRKETPRETLEDDSYEQRVHAIPELDDDQVTIGEVKRFLRMHFESWWEERSRWTRWGWLAYYLPFFDLLRNYKWKEWLLKDILAGLAVAAMLVPQSISYAKLAGLPSTMGLFAFVPVIFYSFFGTCRQLGMGPVAVTSLLIGSSLPKIVGYSSDDPNNPADFLKQEIYNVSAIQIAFIAGILYTSVGILNFGFILNLLSHSVLSGFMTGASLIIGLSQTKYLFGYSQRTYTDESGKRIIEEFPRKDPIQTQLGDLFSADWTPYFRWQEFIMGLSWIAILFAIKYFAKWKKKFEFVRAFGPILVVVLSTAITAGAHLDEDSDKILVVGHIPAGLPKFQSPSTFTTFISPSSQIVLAVIVCVLDMIESMTVARALAASHNYEIEPSRELRGLGIANIAGSICGCYTTTGSFSRSAVNNACGAMTQLSGLITGFIVMFVLIFLTPLFQKLPLNAIGATVIFSVTALFKFKEFMFLWRVNKFDWLVFTVAALTVMFLGVEIGLAISVAVSIGLVLFKSAFPRITVLGRLPGTSVYRNIRMYKNAVRSEMGMIIRIDAPLFFGNVAPVRDRVARLEREFFFAGNVLRWVLVDLSSTTEMDASAMHFLKDWVLDHRKRGVQLAFSNPTDRTLRLMEKTGIVKLLGRQWIHVSVHDAVIFCRREIELRQNFASPTDSLDLEVSASDVDAGIKSPDGEQVC